MSDTQATLGQKTRKRNRIITIIVSIILVIVLIISSLILFHNYYYTSFWVNGQSMYPTLNSQAKYSNGNLIGDTLVGSIANCYDIDYGIMDEHQKAIDNINRGDIIVLKYSDSDSSDKIKRVIVLPGETFYITSSIPGQNDNGNLYILNHATNQYELTEQGIDNSLINIGYYPPQYNQPTTLEDDEIFVMGDNRLLGKSNDSRSNGPFNIELVDGVVVALEAHVKITYSEGLYEISEMNYFWPIYL